MEDIIQNHNARIRNVNNVFSWSVLDQLETFSCAPDWAYTICKNWSIGSMYSKAIVSRWKPVEMILSIYGVIKTTYNLLPASSPSPSWTPPSSSVWVGSSTTSVSITATRTTMAANTQGGSGWPRGMSPRGCCWWATVKGRWWSPGCCGCSLLLTTHRGRSWWRGWMWWSRRIKVRCDVCCKYIERQKVHVCETWSVLVEMVYLIIKVHINISKCCWFKKVPGSSLLV